MTSVSRCLGGVICVAAMFTFVGCPPAEDPALSQAKVAYVDVMAANPQYAAYGLEIAEGAGSSFVRERVVEAIGSDHYPTALVAIKSVTEDPPEGAREALAAAFANKGGALKVHAATALARLGDPAAVAWLEEHLQSGDVALNYSLIRFFADEDREDLLAPLIKKLLASDDPATRNEAYGYLGAARKPWATDLLLKGMDKEFGEGRQQLIAALGQSRDPRAAAKVRRFVNTKGLVFVSIEALGAIGDRDTLNEVQAMAQHDQKLVRVYAGTALWRMGEAEAARAVIDPLAIDEDATVRRNLAEQLGRVAEPGAATVLAALAADGDKSVRIAAVRSLNELGDPGSAPVLLEAVGDSDYEVATVALAGLARVGGADAKERIAPLVANENPYVSLTAALAFLEIDGRTGGGAS
jgi:HEAT repeat protein